MTKREVLARRGGRKADAAGVRFFVVPFTHSPRFKTIRAALWSFGSLLT